jgi:molybdopterin-guanine dinucleotide biosynthesis protein A
MTSLSIQVGGKSSRMGQDKALLDFHGKPLIHHVLNRVSHLANEIFITANQPEKYRFLGLTIFPDIIPDIGPLGGIYTALKTAANPVVYIVACDLPFVNPKLLSRCQDILVNSGIDGVVPQSENGLEPLHAVYRRDTCLPAVEAAIQAGKRRMISWHADAEIHLLTMEEISKYDPHGIAFWNVNTPQEFERAEQKAFEISTLD